MPATKQSNIGLWQGWVPGEDGWGDEMNYNLRSLDGLVQASVIDVINDPPASPSAGDMYQVDETPTGAFSGHNGDLARWSGTEWEFYTPKEGWRVYRLSNDRYRVFRDGDWHRWDSVAPNADTIVKRNSTGQGEFADPVANSHAVTLNYVESNYEKKRQNNLDATSDPGANDDSSAGYEVLSRWVNTSTGELWVCLDATAGSAVWDKSTLTLDELGSAALVDVGTASGQVPTNGDLNIDNWDTAYGWGDHSQAGYALASNISAVGFSGQASDVAYDGSDVATELTNQAAAILDGDRRAVERASGGKLTVLYDDLGNPSLHHIIPKFRYEDLGFDTELGTGVATAFLVNGVEKSEIFVGAHLGSMVNGRLCSIPRVDPAASMDWDAFKAACEAKGSGWHMMTGHEWAAVAFWCAANGYQPRGNTNYGRAHDRTLEMGIRQDGGIAGDASGTARTLTGSGPNQWAHNADPNGIFDLVGNVWEWNDCYKIIDGRIFAAPDNDWTLAEASWTDTGVDIDAANPWTSSAVTGTQLTERLMVTYAGIDLQGRLYVNTSGERMPFRGGAWANGSDAGLGALNLTYTRSGPGTSVGARPVFVSAS